MKQCISYLDYESVWREVLYNIFIQVLIIVKLVKLIKMCPNQACNGVQAGKHDMFPIKNGLKQGNTLLSFI